MTTIESVRVSAQTLKNAADLRILDKKYCTLTKAGKIDEALDVVDRMHELAFDNLRLYREGQRNQFNGNGIDLLKESVGEYVNAYLQTLEELFQLSITLRTERMKRGEIK